MKKYLTFEQFIIKERSVYFLHISKEYIKKFNFKCTLEEYFSDLYLEYQILYN